MLKPVNMPHSQLPSQSRMDPPAALRKQPFAAAPYVLTHIHPAKGFSHCTALSMLCEASPWGRKQGSLAAGVGWRVGCGSSISIWNDAWLPGPDIVNALFTADQAATILSIPLPRIAQQDILIWCHDSSGRYSVKVGCGLLLGEACFPLGDPSFLQKDTSQLYDIVWALPLPPKIKISCWGFFKNYIPTVANLFNRRVNVSPICILCNIDQETVAHLVQDCDHFHQVLTELNLIIPPIPVEHQWMLWLSNLFNAFLKTQLVEQMLNHDRWSPPPTNLVKTNFDASFDLSSKSSISGIIIRNNEGLTMAASSIPNQNIPNPEAAEAWACEQAVCLTRDLGFRSAIVEGDAQMVIRKTSARLQQMTDQN
ncbi:hypothetical protein F3Y22_tig00116962pilonHSYRG00524 [Hibiscus syriacus]|uniref:RNase H type-1 domain-containing protein n=1 Tax=Hibiscus syriacus TaxID=106335 RepID=A0A6A2WJZ0_HIBSY|nr:hypothetical protein F3Y22_tig00116962pilonHSYRG00524 [Hibiscus syriacus]